MKFLVTVCRTSYAFRTFEIDSLTQAAAREMALDRAGDYEFSEKDAEYTVDSVQPITNNKAIQSVMDAYIWMRTNNQSIPDETLDLMKNAAIEALRKGMD